LLHGSPAWFGKDFLLLGSQIGLPDTIAQDEVASLLTWLAILGCSLQPPTVSGSSAIDATATPVPLMTPTAPLPTPSSPATTMADMMAEIRALRALVLVAPTASVPAPPTGMPMFSMAQIEDMSRIFGPGGGGMGGGGFGGPTTINVPPAQSESKRAELAKVLPVRTLASHRRG